MREHELNNRDFVLDEIESITLIGDSETVDITVDDTHMFYANDIYTHNSSASNDIIEADGVADSYRKIMTADFIMSISRKKDDKVSNTARFYVVKNRFGSDGHTFPARMDTSTGDIKLFSDKSEEGVEIMNNLKDCEKAQKKQLSCELKDFLDSK